VMPTQLDRYIYYSTNDGQTRNPVVYNAKLFRIQGKRLQPCRGGIVATTYHRTSTYELRDKSLHIILAIIINYSTQLTFSVLNIHSSLSQYPGPDNR
jgi:hypothetical protein